MRVLGISGSLRATRTTPAASGGGGDCCRPRGVRGVHGLKALPPFDEDDEPSPGPAGGGTARARSPTADALLFATPEYN